MKKGKNPTVAQRRWIETEGLDPSKWLVSKWTPAEATLVHKDTGEVKIIEFLG